jgi:hypothetical protein
LTEARLLWVYLFKAAIGLPRYLGIYQGDPDIARSLADPLTLAACLSWPALAVAAIVTRKRFPWFAFAVLWYLAGHLIESTVVPLELYFEHRNYLPLAGPLVALSAFLLNRDGRSLRVAAAALAAFALWNAFLLHSMASLWGQPAEAARFWAGRYPDSVRAVTRYATYELATGGPGRTIDTIERFAAGHPGASYLRIQTLALGCATGRNQDNGRIAGELQRALPAVDFTYTAGTMLSQLFSIASRTGCKGVDSATVVRLAEALHGNPRYAGDPAYNQFHYKLLAALARSEGDIDAALANLQRAIAYRPSTELDSMMVTALAGDGRFAAAREYLEAMEGNSPRNFLKAFVRQRELQRLHRYVDALERTPDPGED